MWRLVTLMLTGLVLYGCGDDGKPVPVPIYPEEDVCQTCRMLITDQRFAAECLMKKGRARKFDDVICLVRYFDLAKVLGLPGKKHVRAYFVKDYRTKKWISASQAFFVKANVVTVMGYGVVAFKEKKRALEFAKDYHGTLLRFADLWGLFRRPNAEREIFIKNGVMNPDVVRVKYGDLVEIRLNVRDDNHYRVTIKGYGNEGVFPTASKGHPAMLRLNAVRPGSGFAFINLDDNKVMGRFRVEGAHYQEEMKKR